MPFFIILFILCFLVMIGTYIHHKNKHLPPGPYGLPLVGYLPFLGKNPPLTMTNLKEKYGNVVSISLGQKLVVILNDWEAIKGALIKQGATFSGRNTFVWWKKVLGDKDIIFADGLIWKEQRQFSLHILRDFGFGRSSLETRVMYEVDKVTEYLIVNEGKPIEITKLFYLPVINIIWNICAGKHFKKRDEFIETFKQFQRELFRNGSYSILNSLPFLQSILFKWKEQFNKFETKAKKLHEYMEQEVDNHLTNFQENNLRDFIDVYLAKILHREEKSGTTTPPYEREYLLGTLLDFFIAGGDTVAWTLSWTFLYMANETHIQGRVQEELDTVVAKDSFLSMSSKALAPYSEATLLEIQRHATLAPLSISHRVTKDTTLLGYKIPMGTMVYPNIHAVHHDKQYWGDPNTFRPERFLDKTGKKVIRHECFMPFSVGPRACMGETLARLELHLFFTNLLRRFTFETVPGEEKPSMEPIAGDLFVTKPFCLIVKPR